MTQDLLKLSSGLSLQIFVCFISFYRYTKGRPFWGLRAYLLVALIIQRSDYIYVRKRELRMILNDYLRYRTVFIIFIAVCYV